MDTENLNRSDTTIRDLIDANGLSMRQSLIIFVCFMLNIADGFDVSAMAVAGPALAESWSFGPEKLGIVFSAALVGMAVGAMFLAPMSDVIGRRKMLLLSVFAISVSMLLTAVSSTITQLVITRALTGLGIGVILATSSTIATEFAPERLRNFSVLLVTSGFTCGALIVGPIAAKVIPAYGWEVLFVAGGLFSFCMLVLVWFFIPESLEYLAAKEGDDKRRLELINETLDDIKCKPLEVLPIRSLNLARQGSILSLLSKAHISLTVRLWVVFFFGFATNYFLASWIPSLLVNAGFTKTQGIVSLTVFTAGGLIGVWAIGLASTSMKMRQLMPPLMLMSTAVMVVLSIVQPGSMFLINVVMIFLGAGTLGAFTGAYAVAARSYPAEIRNTGMGWCLGLGRFGAILSPILAGYLVALDWNMYSLFILFGIPFAIAAMVMLTIDA